ncbi:MAG: T9SS type A sorting domain-containing protein, partial [Bacteroidales bacterium]|nr:T9SS type A sorting domain-containing protein [Bacteroidales bacterium]
NGNIIINGTGTLQIIDILGKELERKELSTLNSQLSTLNFVPGVYVLRLVGGDSVRTQKIVID